MKRLVERAVHLSGNNDKPHSDLHEMGHNMNASLMYSTFFTPERYDSMLPIRSDLEQVERIISRELISRHKEFTDILDHVSQYKGKRLRPALLLACAHACGLVNESHWVLGAAVELIHTASLVHDDVLDSAHMRRHLPAVHTLWGTKSAILLGDCLFTNAFQMTSNLEDKRACTVVGRSAHRICEGELLQSFHSGDINITEATYLDIIDGKTAEMISASCEVGAAYAGASEAVIKSMASFGRNLGMAFQIADDILDLVGHEKQTGKSLGTDLDQKKLTLPLIWLLQNGPDVEKHKIKSLLENGSPAQRDQVKSILIDSGAIDYAKNKAEQFIAAGKRDLQALAPSAFRNILHDITDQILNRSC